MLAPLLNWFLTLSKYVNFSEYLQAPPLHNVHDSETYGPLWTLEEIDEDALIWESASWYAGRVTAIVNKNSSL